MYSLSMPVRVCGLCKWMAICRYHDASLDFGAAYELFGVCVGLVASYL